MTRCRSENIHCLVFALSHLGILPGCCNECKQKQVEKEDQEIKKILTNRIS